MFFEQFLSWHLAACFRRTQLAPNGSMSWMSMKINSSIRNACLLHGSELPFNRERILCRDLSRGYDKVGGTHGIKTTVAIRIHFKKLTPLKVLDLRFFRTCPLLQLRFCATVKRTSQTQRWQRFFHRNMFCVRCSKRLRVMLFAVVISFLQTLASCE